MLRTLTNLGDSVLLLPASLALLAYLAARREWRLAAAWAATLAACLGTTLVSKLYFHACTLDFGMLTLRSPSGHASFAAVFYVCLAQVAARGRDRALAAAMVSGAVALAAAIALSRPLIRVHTPAEAAVGLAIGLAFAAGFGLLTRGQGGGARKVALRPLVACTALAAVFLNGQHLSAEPYIRGIAKQIARQVDACG